MIRLDRESIRLTYELICEYHEKYLKQYGVKLPKLFIGKNYTKDALTLVYLAQGYPVTRIVSKSELTEFIRLFDDSVLDVQQNNTRFDFVNNSSCFEKQIASRIIKALQQAN